METTDIKTSRPRAGTHLGVPTTSHTVTRKGRRGRVNITTWHARAVGQSIEHPAGTVEARHTTGDFMKGTGITHATATFTSVEDANEWAAKRLA
jgi:hypothetical protein